MYLCFNSKDWDGLLMLAFQMVIKVDVEYLRVMKDCDLKCWLMLGFDSYLMAEAVPFKQAKVPKPPMALDWVVEEISLGSQIWS